MVNYSSHGRKRPSKSRVLVLSAGAVLFYAGVLLGVRTIGNRLEQRDASETVGSLDGRFPSAAALTMQYDGRIWTYRTQDLTNLLLIGVDWDEGTGGPETEDWETENPETETWETEDQETEDPETEESSEAADADRYAGQADCLLLISIDRRQQRVVTLQLDRDTMTDIRIYGPFGDYTGVQEEQICLSHAYGLDEEENCDNTVWAVRHFLGEIPIDGYLSLDMSSIARINDALGGVTVTLEDDFSSFDPEMTAGTTLTLQGSQAEYYVRGRMGVGDGTNSSRMERQRTFIRAAEELLVQRVNEDMNYVGTLFDALDGHMTTNLDRSDLMEKVYECRAYERPETATPEGTHCIGTDGFVEFHADAEALNALLADTFYQ